MSDFQQEYKDSLKYGEMSELEKMVSSDEKVRGSEAGAREKERREYYASQRKDNDCTPSVGNSSSDSDSDNGVGVFLGLVVFVLLIIGLFMFVAPYVEKLILGPSYKPKTSTSSVPQTPELSDLERFEREFQKEKIFLRKVRYQPGFHIVINNKLDHQYQARFGNSPRFDVSADAIDKSQYDLYYMFMSRDSKEQGYSNVHVFNYHFATGALGSTTLYILKRHQITWSDPRHEDILFFEGLPPDSEIVFWWRKRY